MAVGVQGRLRDELLEGAAVGGVPRQGCHVILREAGLGCDLGVVEQAHGVPVLGQAVALALVLGQVGQSGLVDRVIDPGLVGRVGDVHDLVRIDELEQSGGVIDEGIGGVGGGQLRGERVPVLSPCGLRDLDRDVGVGGMEVVSTLLVERGLTVVPQPVVDGDAAVCGGFTTTGCSGVRVAGGQGQRHRCSEENAKGDSCLHGYFFRLGTRGCVT